VMTTALSFPRIPMDVMLSVLIALKAYSAQVGGWGGRAGGFVTV
jgi:hypothetical protein